MPSRKAQIGVVAPSLQHVAAQQVVLIEKIPVHLIEAEELV
jgi:hypothetical protein